MAMIPSERFVFPDLSVIDNLLLGGANERDTARRKERLERVYELFPILRERREQIAGTLSGGQQRMLSLGLLLMAGPKLLMLDEPSLGLAPAIVQQIFDRVRALATEEGMAVLLLEQNVGQALRITDRVYVMRSGRIILEETAEQMRQRAAATGICSDARTGHRARMTRPRSDFLDEPGHLVRIATVDDDGWPRVVPTWFVRDGDDVRVHAPLAGGVPRQPAPGPAARLSIDEDAAALPEGDGAGRGPHPARAWRRRRLARHLPGHRHPLHPGRAGRGLHPEHDRPAAGAHRRVAGRRRG